MKKIVIALLVIGGGVALGTGVASSQAQTAACPAGQIGTPPYCEAPPPPPPPKPLPAACSKLTAKLSLARATFNREARNISILAPITLLASGTARATLQGAGTTTSFNAPVDSENGRIRVTRGITRAQAGLGTGILTLRYPGDADTRAQTVRLRAANNPAALTVSRPTITPAGHLVSQGTIVSSARGVVRVQLEYISRVDGSTTALEFKATISNGKWSLDTPLPASVLATILLRCGTLHSYTLFTGYQAANIRGEMRSFQMLPAI